uniref:acyl-coenzyme A diphosphatase NUDT19-like n=1 Tax=Callithrix jacchus TaxID=9483 RepID=UPI0023DCFFFD|nr:acyl-coenzyme A diphosphatase NUDT19-like [Callithrix jacchus]
MLGFQNRTAPRTATPGPAIRAWPLPRAAAGPGCLLRPLALAVPFPGAVRAPRLPARHLGAEPLERLAHPFLARRHLLFDAAFFLCCLREPLLVYPDLAEVVGSQW